MGEIQSQQSGVARFYDWLAADYDRMTGFEERLERELPLFREIVGRFGIRSVVDAGCGTGFHSILLARLGVQVTAVDLSEAMLAAVRKRVAGTGLDIRTVASSFEDLARHVPTPVDAVFCLGNSLPHLLSQRALHASLSGFAAILRPGGVLFTQTLNYDRILASPERVQNIKETEGSTFIRFYDFLGELIRFNILRLVRQGGNIGHEMRSVDLRPVLKQEFLDLLGQAGFQRAEARADLQGGEFRPSESKDLVVVAVRG